MSLWKLCVLLPGGLLSPDGLSMKAELLVFELFCFRPKTNCRSDTFILAVSSPLRSPIWGAHTYRKEKTLLEVLVQKTHAQFNHQQAHWAESHEACTSHITPQNQKKERRHFILHIVFMTIKQKNVSSSFHQF